MVTKKAAVKTPDKVAKPKRKHDKKAIRLAEKLLKQIQKFIEHVSIGNSPTRPSIRVANGKAIRESIIEVLKDEKDGWVDMPSKKDLKAARKAAKASKKRK